MTLERKTRKPEVASSPAGLSVQRATDAPEAARASSAIPNRTGHSFANVSKFGTPLPTTVEAPALQDSSLQASPWASWGANVTQNPVTTTLTTLQRSPFSQPESAPQETKDESSPEAKAPTETVEPSSASTNAEVSSPTVESASSDAPEAALEASGEVAEDSSEEQAAPEVQAEADTPEASDTEAQGSEETAESAPDETATAETSSDESNPAASSEPTTDQPNEAAVSVQASRSDAPTPEEPLEEPVSVQASAAPGSSSQGGSDATLGADVRALSGGQPLEPTVRSELEAFHNADLGGVRTFVDPGLTSRVQARAFTTGQNLVFNAPNDLSDRELLAHETAHVKQQAQGEVSGSSIAPGVKLSDPSDSYEREASSLGASFASRPRSPKAGTPSNTTDSRGEGTPSQTVFSSGTTSGSIQRQPAAATLEPPKVQSQTDSPQVPREKIIPNGGVVVLPVGASTEYRVDFGPTISDGKPYTYEWHWINDPAAQKTAGPGGSYTGPVLKLTATVPGRHTISVKCTKQGSPTYSMSFVQVVKTIEDIAQDAQAKQPEMDYTSFRVGLEMRAFDLADGGIKDQSDPKSTHITSNGSNPASEATMITASTPPPTYTYTLENPSPTTKKHRWYAVPSDWKNLPTQNYYGIKTGEVDGKRVFDLGAKPSAEFVIASRGTYAIICDEMDASGKITNTVQYKQVVLSSQEAEQYAQWKNYTASVEKNISKIGEGKEVGVKAVLVEGKTGKTFPLNLFIGSDATDPKRVKLMDLTPGAEHREFGGANAEEAVQAFDGGNEYPKGKILFEIPQNKSGIAPMKRWIETDGETSLSTWASRGGMAALGLGLAGVAATLIPGAQVAAPYLFVAAAAAGAAASAASITNELRKENPSTVNITIDVLMIASSVLGAGAAFGTALKGTFIATKAGRFLMYTGFALDAGGGVLIGAQGVSTINATLGDEKLSRDEKIARITRILANLALQGGLLIYGARNLKGTKPPTEGGLETRGYKPQPGERTQTQAQYKAQQSATRATSTLAEIIPDAQKRARLQALVPDTGMLVGLVKRVDSPAQLESLLRVCRDPQVLSKLLGRVPNVLELKLMLSKLGSGMELEKVLRKFPDTNQVKAALEMIDPQSINPKYASRLTMLMLEYPIPRRKFTQAETEKLLADAKQTVKDGQVGSQKNSSVWDERYRMGKYVTPGEATPQQLKRDANAQRQYQDLLDDMLKDSASLHEGKYVVRYTTKWVYENRYLKEGRISDPSYMTNTLVSGSLEAASGAQLKPQWYSRTDGVPEIALLIPIDALKTKFVPRPSGERAIGQEFTTNAYPEAGKGGMLQFLGTTGSMDGVKVIELIKNVKDRYRP